MEQHIIAPVSRDNNLAASVTAQVGVRGIQGINPCVESAQVVHTQNQQ